MGLIVRSHRLLTDRLERDWSRGRDPAGLLRRAHQRGCGARWPADHVSPERRRRPDHRWGHPPRRPHGGGGAGRTPGLPERPPQHPRGPRPRAAASSTGPSPPISRASTATSWRTSTTTTGPRSPRHSPRSSTAATDSPVPTTRPSQTFFRPPGGTRPFIRRCHPYPPSLRSPPVVASFDGGAATSRQLASLAGRIVLLAAELDRREGWRDEGATSVESWLTERCNVSTATARAWSHVGARLFDLPQLADGLCEGRVSFDQVRAVAGAATPGQSGPSWPRPPSARCASCPSWPRLHPAPALAPPRRPTTTRCALSASTTRAAP